jgi:hypothetical protein
MLRRELVVLVVKCVLKLLRPGQMQETAFYFIVGYNARQVEAANKHTETSVATPAE